MKQIIFYFKSTIFENSICSCYPVAPNAKFDNENGYQFTTMRKLLFDKFMSRYSLQYEFMDITGFSSNPEGDILNMGLHSSVSQAYNKKIIN